MSMSDEHGDNIRTIEDGLRRLEREGIQVKLSTRKGLLGRECPSCQRFFEIEVAIDDLPTMHCPYCGRRHPQSQFFSRGQVDLARATAAHEANKAIAQALGQRPTVSAPSGRLAAGESTSEDLRCSQCRLRFGVNGGASHCPRCGADPA